MVVVHRFRWFGWFVLCVGVILGCYLMSSRVAAERNKLADVERAIASTQRDIRALETEFDTRANLAQLQRWNGDTLKLSAPTEGQYVRSDTQLASLDFGSGVQNAAVIPSAPVATTIETLPASVTVTTPAAKPAKAIPAVASASATPAAATRAKPRMQTAAVVTTTARARPQVAMLDRRIMGGSSLGDLMRRVGTESGGQ